MSAQTSTVELLLQLVREGIFLALVISAPAVLAALIAGFVVSVLQAATQIGEPSLSFVPKLAAAVIALIVSAPWMTRQVHDFTIVLWQLIPGLAQS